MSLFRLRTVYFVNLFLQYLPTGLVFPVITLYLLDQGFSLGIIGSALSVYSLTVLLLELPTGGLADRIGRVRLYRFSLAMKFFNFLFFLFCFNYFLLLLAMILQGVTRALNSGSLNAWFVDEHNCFSEKETRKSLSLVAGVEPAAIGVATLLGGMLPDIINTPKTIAWTGQYGINILVVIPVILLHIVFIRIFIFEPQNSRKKQKVNNRTSFIPFLYKILRAGLSSLVLRRLLFISLFLGIGLSFIEGLWQPRFLAVSPEAPGLILGILSSLYFFGAAAGSFLSETLIKTFGERITLIAAKLMHGIFLILLAWQGNTLGFSICFSVLFVFHGALDGPHNFLLNRNIPDGVRSSLLSLDSLFLMAGASAGALFAGWGAEWLGIPLVWTIGGILLILSSLLYLGIPAGKKENKEVKNAVHL